LLIEREKGSWQRRSNEIRLDLYLAVILKIGLYRQSVPVLVIVVG
jgi:hypothetical protein